MPDPSADAAPARGPFWKWWVCGLLLLATMLNYMDRLTLNLTAARVMAEFGLDERDYGQLESAFAFAFALGAIVFGWLADRWNVTWLYPLAVLAWSVAGFATGLATTFAGLLACRFLLGLAEAGNWPCALRTTQKVMPASQRSMGNSLLQSGAAFGAIVTPLIVRGLVLEGSPASYPEWVAGAVGGLAGAGQPGVPFAGTVAAALMPVYRPGAWRYPFMAVGAVGVTWVVLWLVSLRRADLAVERRASPSLIGIVGWLAALVAVDFALQAAAARGWVPAQKMWLVLAVKLGVGGLGIAAVARWLFRCTAADGAGEELRRRDFVRRFWVLVVLAVTINTTWHFFRAWMPLFLQKQHGFGESALCAISSNMKSRFFAGFQGLAAFWAGLPNPPKGPLLLGPLIFSAVFGVRV